MLSCGTSLPLAHLDVDGPGDAGRDRRRTPPPARGAARPLPPAGGREKGWAGGASRAVVAGAAPGAAPYRAAAGVLKLGVYRRPVEFARSRDVRGIGDGDKRGL